MNDNKLDSKNVDIDFSKKKSICSIKENDNEIVLTIPKNKNYTLEDLKQKIVNSLYSEDRYYSGTDAIELLDVILRNGY